jgi:murein DD-endopeptidase MepM/ murein hydrolase activator NlpD
VARNRRRIRALSIALVAVAAASAFAGARAASAAEPKAQLAKITFGSRVLKQGMSGTDVRVLQKWLKLLGIDTDVDGSFGPATKKSVKKWEKKGGMPTNGVVTLEDAKKLRDEIAASPEAQRNADDPKPKNPPTTGQTPPGNESGFIFPIQGKYSWGTAQNRFGAPRGGRSHMGQDVMADCGLLIKDVEPGKVVYAGYQGAAGNYIVIDGAATGTDYGYMHLAEPSPFRKGDRVYTGQRIGSVGQTGNARGCHLHFELWSAPGWYRGGRPFDPLPSLKASDAYS